MAYIYPAPGVATVEMTLTLTAQDGGGDLLTAGTGGANDPMVVPAIQDINLSAANDVFSWTQLDEASKLQIATTATNSLSGNIVVEEDTFFGLSTADGVEFIGIFGLSNTKRLTSFALYLGDNSDGSQGKTLSGDGYITGLSPSVSSDSPVWVSPFTLTVTGSYTVA